ncbi:MAG: branched-chain amino acid aminotransferase [Bacteroidetes bacterium]|nr:branched-chain amino acid aminotransferase [Bacteroidota bacterium]
MSQIDTASIKISRAEGSKVSEVDFGQLPFGRVFTDHMLVAYTQNGNWEQAEIKPFGNISIHPALSALHYGQSIFEGMKAYRDTKGNPLLFRPMDNYERFVKSAERMFMAPVPKSMFMEGIKALVSLDREWIPAVPGGSLYVRPLLFATDPYVGIKPSDNYCFIVFACPVGAYYAEAINVYIEEKYTRAAEGGVGAVKAAGNYAASLYPNKFRVDKGYRQLVWTDAKEHKYIEESGTMNIFFVINGKVITPDTSRDTILKGVTRMSVISLAKDMGYEVEERRISVMEVIDSLQNGTLTEAFGSGTAATIAHIAAIGYREGHHDLPSIDQRPISTALLNRLTNIRTGVEPDPYGWVVKV